jgi:flagellar biogenesis protein FliO
MDSLFGVEVSTAARFIIAFVVVLALIALTAWLVRRFGRGALASAGGRGRQPRLAVIDAATVDPRRKLILVRRDNVEHLLMIGGPSDVVVESNIVRAVPAAREAPATRTAPVPEAMPRPVPLEEATMWPLQPEPASRLQPQWNGPAADQPDNTVRSPHPDRFAELADAPPSRTPPRIEPELDLATVVPEPRDATQTPADHRNLIEMAHRLEAALRGAGEPRLDIPLTEPPRAGHPSDAEATAVVSHGADADGQEVRPVSRDARGNQKRLHELEQEMASLLGRPTGKT